MVSNKTYMAREEVDAQYELDRPWIELWDALLQFGMALFEPDGRGVIEGWSLGTEHLEGLRAFTLRKFSHTGEPTVCKALYRNTNAGGLKKRSRYCNYQ